MEIDTIQETDSDQIYRIHLDNTKILVKIICKESEEWYQKQGSRIYNSHAKILVYFDGKQWIELARRPSNTSKETMIALAKSLIPTAIQTKSDLA